MCVILIKDKSMNSSKFNKHELEAHFRVNHDGAGICCINKNKVWVPFKCGGAECNFDKIWEEIVKYENDNDVDTMIVHFRFGNQGGRTIKQAHPHTLIENSLYLIHNGTFRKYIRNRSISDTQQMCNFLIDKFKKMDIYSFSQLTQFIINKMNDEFMYQNVDNRVVIAGVGNYIIFNTIGAARYGYWYKDGIWRCGKFGDFLLPEKCLFNKCHYAINYFKFD